MKCPFCKSKKLREIDYLAMEGLTVYVYCCCTCDMPFSTEKRFLGQKRSFVELDSHQNIPERIAQLFPKSFFCYCQAQCARDNKLNELAGVGLRMALETLVWEYLVYTGKLKPTKNAPMLYEMLNMLDVGIYSKSCAQIIKTYGNKVVHVTKDLPPISLKEAFEVYEILCSFMENELHLLELNDKTSKSHQAKA